jgi:RHS repeat-associated protein
VPRAPIGHFAYQTLADLNEMLGVTGVSATVGRLAQVSTLPTTIGIRGTAGLALAIVRARWAEADKALGLSAAAGFSVMPANLGIRSSVMLGKAIIRYNLSHVIVVWPTGAGIPVPIWIPFTAKQVISTAPPSPLSVSTILITPARRAAFVGDRIAYSGQSRDGSSAVIHGIKHTWSTPDPDKVSVDEAGRAVMLKPGLARIVCTAGTATATALVLIRPGSRGVQTDKQWGQDQGSGTSGMGSGTGGGGSAALVGPPAVRPTDKDSLISRIINKLAPTVEAQNGGGGSGAAYYNGNWVIGTPRNAVIEPTRFGAVLPESYNYELAIPIAASVGNRELDVPLTLYYNSNIYSTIDPLDLQFDPNQSWPAPGFSLGFGRIDTTLSADGQTAYYTFVEPNGTRHYLGAGPSVVTGGPPPYPTYTTSDGTYISYVGDAVHGGELYYPSGTKYDINLVNNRLQVTQITTTNGNYIQIGYMQNIYDGYGNPVPPVYSPFAISYVIDTLGRQVNFGYSSPGGIGLLTSVSGPSGGASLGYQYKSLITNFYSNQYSQPMTVQGLPPIGPSGYPTAWLLSGISAQQAYQMSYSDYGMAYSFTMGRTNTATVTFDYATSGSTQLGGAPAFTQRTETTGTTTGTYTYSVGWPATTITRPDSSTLTLTDNGSFLLGQAEVKLETKSYAKTVYFYGNDPGGAPQITTAMSYDDTGTPRRIDYGYDQYGNVTSKLEYGFQVNGPWLRKTTLTYAGDPWTTNFMRRLVTGVNVYDSNNNQIAGTSYGYSGVGQCYYPQSTAPGHLANFSSSIGANLSTITRLTDVAHGISTTRSASYDCFGNVIQVDMDCCKQKTYTFSQGTWWSQPDQTTTGSGSTTLTNSSVYNFNTSATTSATDPNGLTTNFSVNSWLDPTQVAPPSGSDFSMGYGDLGDLDSMSASYTDGGVNKSFSASITKDAWANPILQFDPYGNQINLSYDAMGRLVSKSNPFPKNGVPGPMTTYQCDAMGRNTVVTLPNGNTVKYSYSGSTFTITDQVGRQTQQRYDGLGRLVTVTEQDPSSGQLTLATNYTYDLLDNVVQVNQEGQIRAFKYDAAKRKIYERTPEQTATINDGTSTMWSCAYTYTNFDALATKTDSRGVVTTFRYDSLNRLVSKSYNLSNAPGVGATNNVTFTYDTSSTSSTKGLLLSITMSGTLPTYQESFSYDTFNRIAGHTWTRDGQSYTIGYQRNNLGQLTQLVYPSGRKVNINHDSFGRLSSLSDATSGAQYVSNFSFNSAGMLTGDRFGNGVTETFGYDSQTLQLISQSATAPGGASGGLLNLNLSYQAAAGQLGMGTAAGNGEQLVSISNSSINGKSESGSYTYDTLSRLATSIQTTNGVTAQRRYTVDTWGNRTGEWDAVSGGNQLQSIALQQSGGVPTNQIQSVTASGNTTPYTYDAAGNLTSDGLHTYQYDAEDRIVTVDSGNTAAYAYDYLNRRLRKAVGSAVTHYIWEGSRVIAEHNGSTGAQVADYVFSRGMLLGEGTGTSYTTSASFTFQINDRLSERVLLDNSAHVLGVQSHLPFGEEVGESGTQEKHHFTNYEADAETGQDYALRRYYSSGLGRFASPDARAGKRSSPQTWNRYAYASDSPLDRIDPLGLTTCITDYTDYDTPYSEGGTIRIGVISIANKMCWADASNGPTSGGDPGAGSGPGPCDANAPPPPANGTSAPLTGAPLGRLNAAFNELVAQLMTGNVSSTCQQNVINKLDTIKGFNLEAFANYLYKGANFYDGTQSNVSPVPAIFPNAQVLRNTKYKDCPSVAAMFAYEPGLQATASETSSILSIYFVPGAVSNSNAQNRALLFHEALHGFGASVGSGEFYDQNLQDLFGLGRGPSSNITDYIKKNCF